MANKARRSGTGGMTLVEVIVAVFIISLAAVMLAGIFGAASSVTVRAALGSGRADEALAAIESGSAPAVAGSASFSAGGVEYKVDGVYRTSGGEEGSMFYAFESERSAGQ